MLDDLLDLRRGDQVPVDAAVVQAEGLELDEALLTGEAEPDKAAWGDGAVGQLRGRGHRAGAGDRRGRAVLRRPAAGAGAAVQPDPLGSSRVRTRSCAW